MRTGQTRPYDRRRADGDGVPLLGSRETAALLRTAGDVGPAERESLWTHLGRHLPPAT